ncbi:hypothetical protein H4R19_002362 [Coemansia spiralis]|nr:hypothetical protein H4R19_002362 [Coemansia spiralis]
MSHSVCVSYKGSPRELSVDDATTLAQLRVQIEQAFGVAAGNQRLLYKGELVDNGALVQSLVPARGRIVLVGPTASELAAHQASAARREAGRANNERYRATAADVRKTPRARDEFGFMALEALSLPRRDDALRLLRRLAADEGVRGVMCKHRYTVGALRELHPNERTILGYNRNRGQVIALRLRTDDLEGFRSYLAVRQVLMHELAHMVWDAHDDRFHALNRQHCKEVIDLDWSRAGHTVGPAGAVYAEPQPSDAAHVDGGSLGATGFVLGGAAPLLPPDPPAGDGDAARHARREQAYRAWQKRSGQQP